MEGSIGGRIGFETEPKSLEEIMMMNSARKLGITAAAVAAMLTSAALAQEVGGQRSDQMMQNQDGMSGSMMEGDMPGMMQMMQQMGPMMEACTNMMQAMTKQMDSPSTEPQDG